MNLDLPATFLDLRRRPRSRPTIKVAASARILDHHHSPPTGAPRPFTNTSPSANRIPALGRPAHRADFKYVHYFRPRLRVPPRSDKTIPTNAQKPRRPIPPTAVDPRGKCVKRTAANSSPNTAARCRHRQGDPFKASTEAHPARQRPLPESRPDADGFVNLLDGHNPSDGWEGDSAILVSRGRRASPASPTAALKMNRFHHLDRLHHPQFRDCRARSRSPQEATAASSIAVISRPRPRSRHRHGLPVRRRRQQPGLQRHALRRAAAPHPLTHRGKSDRRDPEGQPWVIGARCPRRKSFAPDEWHEYRVLVRGQSPPATGSTAIPPPTLIDLDPKKAASLEGVLAVQVHVGPAMEIQYKDFKIKHLPDDLPLLKAEGHPDPG
jgi:choline-sulfatase